MSGWLRSNALGLLSLALRWYLGAVFVLACLYKIAEPADFALQVATYEILPLALVNLQAVVLPWLELVVASMLIVGFRVRASALLIAGMMVMFMVALGIALARGLDLSCGCFAAASLDSDPISWKTMLRDAVWLAMSGFVLLFDRRPFGIDGWLMLRSEAK